MYKILVVAKYSCNGTGAALTSQVIDCATKTDADAAIANVISGNKTSELSNVGFAAFKMYKDVPYNV